MNDKEDLTDFIHSDRREFSSGQFERSDVADDPVEQFMDWMSEAKESSVVDPHAMCLSTVDPAGYPQSRVVYLRDVSEGGFVFFTNYQSDKGSELEGQGKASLNFHWQGMERQIRIVGRVERTTAQVSDDYFASRPRESQVGAWASHQSEVLKDRAELIARLDSYRQEFDGQEVPRPPHWGGYVIRPVSFEFWQGRSSRLHDRFRYRPSPEGGWTVERLSP